MNLAGKGGGDILCINFNQDYGCVAVGTRSGYRIYTISPFLKAFSADNGGIGIVEMLFSTSLVALVGAGEQPAFSPRRLQICNTKSRTVICELNFLSTVLSVKMNRKRLVVVLETKIHIYDLSNLKVLYSIDTDPNPKGVCALSPDSGNCYVAYCSSQSIGEVAIFDTLSLQVVNVINAHKSSIAHLQFNSNGTLLATASEKGTVLRVFSIPEGLKLYTLRRGSIAADLFSIAFSTDSKMICSSSGTGTVHVFRLEDTSLFGVLCALFGTHLIHTNITRTSGSKGEGRLTSQRSEGVTKYLPEMLSDVIDSQRGVVQIKIPEPSTKLNSVCCFEGIGHTYVLVATADGMVYRFRIDINEGGLGVLENTHRLAVKDSTDVGISM